MKNKLLITIIATLTAIGMQAQTTALDYFSMPEARIAAFCTDTDDRLNMADYFRADMSTPTELVHGQLGRVVNASDNSVTWQAVSGVTSTLYIIGNGKKTRLLVIETINDPAPDSRLMWYDAKWNTTKSPVDAPMLADWLTPEGLKEIKDVEDWLPYMTATARLSDDGKAIVYTNTLNDRFLSSEDLANIKKWIKPQITVKL